MGVQDRELDNKRVAQNRNPVLLPWKFCSSAAVSPAPVGTDISSAQGQISPVSLLAFDVSRHVGLVPVFRKDEVDVYFSVFERIATTLNWPKSLWTVLLQCKLSGKAQEACSALTLEPSLDYDAVKATVLRKQ